VPAVGTPAIARWYKSEISTRSALLRSDDDNPLKSYSSCEVNESGLVCVFRAATIDLLIRNHRWRTVNIEVTTSRQNQP
jgi:hypothetical protein